MRVSVLILAATLVALIGLAAWQGQDVVAAGWRTSRRQVLQFLPLLVVAVTVAGFAETLLPRELIERWLSDAAGWRGIGLAWLAGVLTPGGSLVGLPLVAVLYKAGVGISVLMTYLTALATLSLLRVPLEVGFYGWRLTGLRIVVSLALPFVAGGLTRLLQPLFVR